MELELSPQFEKGMRRLDRKTRELVYAKLELFLQDKSPPSLRYKPVQGLKHLRPPVKEISITMSIRITLQEFEAYIYLRNIGGHDILPLDRRSPTRGGYTKMAALMARELLKNEVEALPEPMAAEVLDFVLFVKARHNEETFLWRQIEAAQEHRRQHPEEVLTVTAAEWDTLTAELEGDADGVSTAL